MTGLLTDLMRERANGLEHREPDVSMIVREGDKRVRRRRAAVASGAAALATVAALVVPPVVGGGDPRTVDDPDRLAPSIDHGLTYAQGSRLTIDGTTVDVGHEVHGLVQTDVGVVFNDPDGAVWSYVDGEAREVGHMGKDWLQLVSDGRWAAWVDAEAPEREFAVLDQATGEVVRDPLAGVVHPDELTDADASIAISYIYVLDGPVAYLRDAGGIQAWDSATGHVRLLSTDRRPLIQDVEGGTIVSTLAQGSARYAWVGETVGAGLEIDTYYADDLSPGGRYLLGSAKVHDMTIFDARTGQAVPKQPQVPDYDFARGFEWLDDQHYLAFGYQWNWKQDPIDLLRCAVATGACTAMAEDFASLSLVLATGQRAP